MGPMAIRKLGVEMSGEQINEAGSYVEGQGSPMVLLHGLGGSWHIWKPVIPLLAQNHQVHAITLPGHLDGLKLEEGTEPSVSNLADRLAKELTDRGLDKAHLVGNSLGGLMALELARRGRALSVTALSPAGAWQSKDDFIAVAKKFRLVFALMWLLILLVSLFTGFAKVRRVLNADAMEHGNRMPEPEFRRAMQSLRQTRILPKLLDCIERDGAIEPMSAGEVPIRIAWCEHDKVIPFETYGKPMLEAVQGAQHVTIRGVGHVPMYDDPEQVSRIILANSQTSEAVAA